MEENYKIPSVVLHTLQDSGALKKQIIRNIFGRNGVEGIAVFFDEAPAQETGAVIKAEQFLCKKNAGG
jgi:hypothetical protein